MIILQKNIIYFFLFLLALFVLAGCCDDNFKVDRNVRIIDQGVNAEYRYKIFLNSVRCGSSRHGISFSTHEYKDRDSIEFNQRIGNFYPDNFRLTKFTKPPPKGVGVSGEYIVSKDNIKGSIQVEKDLVRVNLQLDSSISYGKNLPAQYKPYAYNGIYILQPSISD